MSAEGQFLGELYGKSGEVVTICGLDNGVVSILTKHGCAGLTVIHLDRLAAQKLAAALNKWAIQE